MFGLGAPEIFLIFAILLLLFGATQLPKLARSMGRATKEVHGVVKGGLLPSEKCVSCGTELESDARFCSSCGSSVQPATKLTA